LLDCPTRALQLLSASGVLHILQDVIKQACHVYSLLA
jgi:hypothetical protein